jgi:hypothetical protein
MSHHSSSVSATDEMRELNPSLDLKNYSKRYYSTSVGIISDNYRTRFEIWSWKISCNAVGSIYKRTATKV